MMNNEWHAGLFLQCKTCFAKYIYPEYFEREREQSLNFVLIKIECYGGVKIQTSFSQFKMYGVFLLNYVHLL